jgi:hypothetical protein
VSYFALNSIFNWSPRGAIYLIGLLLLSGLTIALSILLPDNTSDEPDKTCNIITLSGDISQPTSNVPLNMVVYTYTLSYMITSTLLYVNQVGLPFSPNNSGTIILFCLLIIGEAIKMNMHCFNFIQLSAAMTIGIVGGILWGKFIFSLASPDLSFFSTSTDICTVQNNHKYQCSPGQ